MDFWKRECSRSITFFSKILGGMRCMTYFSLATPVCIFEQAPYRAMTQGTCIMNSGSSPNRYIGEFQVVVPTTQNNFQSVF